MIIKLFQKNTDYKVYSLIIHSLIRNMFMNGDFKKSYQKLAVQMFPLYESAIRRKENSINQKQLKEIGEYLFELDEEEQVVATCVSVAATLQVILFCKGIQAELLIGVKKIDGKLFAHAWVKLPNGEVIDPQDKYSDLKVTQIFKLKDEAERWAVSVI
ncbi:MULTISPECIES: lasso peptide biosynthesis B2 protein [Bacillus]|uniref:Microcin J25-processing protein McjB C-terminal domain-containing protein n=1 Tax=Bacillus cereus TaxID=1396 RepID=A0A2C1LXV9_BACCE|nr:MULTISPECIES: lasso peptide biosynthesis B2 protein [Bacillus]MDH4424705.1 lasso peptide biosynthesis B2 protein [Bacillus cereus]PGL82360.1 hypothetical protein CN931_14925 [Bacillus sp. AFS054943]PGU02800.1 hypothetical protein COD19_10700 [Bacillus cereus]PGX16221.1 hypothetical protein COE07_01800 [Bacillus sp. AFS033286]PGZ68484.1 hypothetical protein COE49_25345 [Bacillus sp. AFS029637]